MCDGVIHCQDKSDECNDSCSKQILEGTFFKVISWIIGLSAVVANIPIIFTNTSSIRGCKTSMALINKVLILSIGLGDLMVGVYLVAVATADSLVYGKRYCLERTFWLTSSYCSLLGVISTLGSQISLFSMAALSIARVVAVLRSKKIAGKPSKMAKIGIWVGGVLMFVFSFIK